MSESPFTPRKGLRSKKPSLKAQESSYVEKLKYSGFIASASSSDEFDEDLKEDIKEWEKLSNNSNNIQIDDEVKGQKIFSFQKRKTIHGLAQKVQETLSCKTPSDVRKRLKHGIKQIMQISSDEDFSASEDEYLPSDSSKSASRSDESESAEDASDSSQDISKNKISIFKKKTLNLSENKFKTKTSLNLTESDTSDSEKKSRNESKLRRKKKGNKYVIKTDEYFTNHASKKILTSNHTLDKLETPRLPQDQLFKLLKTMKLSNAHRKSLKSLSKTNVSCFKKWTYLLNENFNILLYGLGSKRTVLQEFHQRYLKNWPVIVVNGFFPSLTIKDVLDSITNDLLELKESPVNVYEACELIEMEFGKMSNTHLYILVHNIDGEMLRNSKSQNVLARLASVRNIHLVASVDHINAPLIWDYSKLSKLNYIWWDVTTFLPYLEETSFETSMLIQGSGTLALSSLRNVFLSLTSNSKGIYLAIVKYQLENGKNQYYSGLSFKDLYSTCREAFVVSSDLALRAQLTEFVDHKMVKFKRSVDGVENLIIPIANTLLQKFLDEQSK